MNKHRNLEDLTGKTFGLLTVVDIAPKVLVGNQLRPAWHVACKCGNVFKTPAKYLKRGTGSCKNFECRKEWLAHPAYKPLRNK